MALNFFTATFPYRKGEAFIENEIPILAKHFDSVRVFPYRADLNETPREIPGNCQPVNRPACEQTSIGFSDFMLILGIINHEFWRTKNKGFFLKNFRRWYSLCKKAIRTSNWILQQKGIKKDDYYYSFWMNDWALALAILKKKNKIDSFVFRCAGFDIWDERHEGNYLPFRSFIYQHAKGIFPNSKTAETYLKSKKIYPEKIQHHYLGTSDYGLAKFDTSSTFTLLSISGLIPLKRVHLIIDILAELSFKVRWFHIGSGPEQEKIAQLAKQKLAHQEVEFLGFLSRDEYLNVFKNQSVNLFISVSETEGLPVTLQEATSFGIPCLATDVGGVSEVVTNETGILIPAHFDPKEVAQQIVLFSESIKNTENFRKGVRAFWEKHFNKDLVYRKFIEDEL